MRLNYIHSSEIPGLSANSVHVMKMCEAFKNLDMEIKLYLPRRTDYQIKQCEFQYYGIKNEFDIKRFAIPNINTFWGAYYYALTSVFYALREKPDIVYTRFPQAAFLLSFTKQKFIFEYHGTQYFDSKYKERIFCANNLLRFVVITNTLREYYQSCFKVPISKMLVLPDGVNLEEYGFINKNILQNKRLNIAYVGGLYEGKGVDIVVEMAKRDPSNNYLIVGGRAKQVEAWKKIIGSMSNLQLIGQIPNAEVPLVLEKQDVLLLPNQRKMFGNSAEDIANWTSPMKMFEYMASGRVIISSNLPVLKEVLEDRKNAYLVEPDNVDAWLETIRRIERNPDEARRIAKQAEQDVQNYSWTRRAERIIDVMKRT